MHKGRRLTGLFVLLWAGTLLAAPFQGGPGSPESGLSADDWPWWRGPHRNGVAVEQDVPASWNSSSNILWQAEVPGRGHSSPVVVGRRIFLTTADPQAQTQSVLCYDRATGRLHWQRTVFKGGFEKKVHARNTQATPTPACDGKRVYVSFLNDGHVWLVAFSLDGEELWRNKLTSFKSLWGFSTSPVWYKGRLIVAADHLGVGTLTAVDAETGKQHWQEKRTKWPNHASPTVLHVAGSDQLLINGLRRIMSYQPMTGKLNWSAPATTVECVGTVVTDGQRVFGSGGYPDSITTCVMGDGSKEKMWENKVKIYASSLLVHEGYVYGVRDNGFGYCWNAATGKEQWTVRLGGQFSSAPVLVGDTIYICGEKGLTVVYKANPKRFDVVNFNQLGDEIFASPAICGGNIFLRVAERTRSDRQESLYCIGRK